MALRVHMTIEGATQGQITEACSLRTGREDTVELIALNQGISIPTNDESGQITGHARFEPLIVTKEIDRSSPMIQKGLVTNEVLKVTLQFYRFATDGKGKEELYYTILLERATVANYRGVLHNTLDAASAKLPALETVGFAFRDITVTYEPNGISYHYSLDTPEA